MLYNMYFKKKWEQNATPSEMISDLIWYVVQLN